MVRGFSSLSIQLFTSVWMSVFLMVFSLWFFSVGRMCLFRIPWSLWSVRIRLSVFCSSHCFASSPNVIDDRWLSIHVPVFRAFSSEV